MKLKKASKYLWFIFPLFIGFMPLCLSKKNLKKKHIPLANSHPLDKYNGRWASADKRSTIVIESDSAVLANDKPFQLAFQEIRDNQIVFKDPFGYDVIIEDHQPQSIKLFDEAEEEIVIYYKEYTD